ncbi:MAG: prephenate dehydrogenase [Phycisphaerae bacterium]
MEPPAVQHVTIVGVGLLGGSAGLAIRRHWPDARIIGVGRRMSSLTEALNAGCIDEAGTDPLVASESDLVLLCTPVRAIETLLGRLAGSLREDVLITDVGSTKTDVVSAATTALGEDGPFVGSHPMAGSEKKGPRHADADLYRGATCVLTPTARTPAHLLARARGLWETLGMRCVEMSPKAHDQAVACVSHLPHVLASLLMLLPAEEDLQVAATGFADMTRLAAGDPEMWRDICLTNSAAIAESIDALVSALSGLRDDVLRGDGDALQGLLARAQQRKLGQDG